LRPWLASAPAPPADHVVDDTLLGALMDGADARRASRVSRFTVAATRLALVDAGLDDAGAAGFVLGTEHGDLHSAIEFAEGFLRGGPSGVSALAFPNTVMNTMVSAATIACAAHGASPIGEILGAAWRGLPARPNGVGRRAESRAIAAALAEAGSSGRAITWAYSSSSGDGPRDAWERALLVRALGSEITVASLA